MEIDLNSVESEFEIFSVSYKILKKVNDLQLIEVQENSYKRSYPIYYSRIFRYRLLGYLMDETPFTKPDYLNSTCCFDIMNEQFICNKCNKKSSGIFINCRIFFSHNYYKKLEKKYNIDFTEEFIRDQKRGLSDPEKEEIIANALCPERVMKILRLSNDHWTNISKYI